MYLSQEAGKAWTIWGKHKYGVVSFENTLSEWQSDSLTHEVPLPVGYVCGCVHVQHLEVQQPAVVRPGAKLQVTLLHIEREPAHVDVAGALQDARGNVLAVTRSIHQNIGVEGGVEPLVCTEERMESDVCVSVCVCCQHFHPLAVTQSSGTLKHLLIAFLIVFDIMHRNHKLAISSKWVLSICTIAERWGLLI